MAFSPEHKTNILIAVISAFSTVAIAWFSYRPPEPVPAPAPIVTAGEPQTNPGPSAPVVQEKQKAIAAALSKAWVYGTYEDVSDQFTVSLKATLPVKRIQQFADSIKTVYGPFREQAGVDIATHPPGYNQAVVTNRFANGNILLMVWFDNNDQVNGLWCRGTR